MILRNFTASLMLTGLVAATFAANAVPMPPTSGAYVTDKQEQYVQDAATDAIANANQTICFIANIRADAMVNKGHYIALVDSNACKTAGKDASQSSSTASVTATNYDQHSATVTRADNNSPQILKGHVQMMGGDGNTPFAIYTHGSNSAAPTTALPNGQFYLDYAGFLRTATQANTPSANKQSGSEFFRGKVAAAAAGVTMSEIGAWGSTRLYSKGNGDSGSGIVENINNSNTSNYTFGYNSRYFCRDVGGEKCFDRSIANANISVWRYGLYDSTGKQFDISNPSFDIKDADGGYGHASYWGIWTNAAQTDGMALKNQKDPTISYTLKKSGGKLIKHQQNQVTLDVIKNNRFQFYKGQASANNNVLAQGSSYEASWDGSNFIISNKINCGLTGCFSEKIVDSSNVAQPITLSANDLNLEMGGYGVYGWSPSLGGGSLALLREALINANPGTYANGVRYESVNMVLPNEAVPSSLTCVNNCPTPTSLAGASNSVIASGNAFELLTQDKWGGTPLASAISYTWDSVNYSLTFDGDSTHPLSNSQLPAANLLSPKYNWGLSTGALVDSAQVAIGAAMDCDGVGGNTDMCDYKARDLPVYYTFETGPQNWNIATFLKKSDNSYVTFSPPLDATYNVPTDPTYGDSSGATMHLQFNGFGDLQGIPGKCISPTDNAEVSCGPTTSWVSAFSIPTGDTVTINNTIYYVKWLNRQVNFKLVSGDHTANSNITDGIIDMCVGCTLPAAMVLTGDANDPSVSANAAVYSGPYDNVDFSLKPAVIQGLVQ